MDPRNAPIRCLNRAERVTSTPPGAPGTATTSFYYPPTAFLSRPPRFLLVPRPHFPGEIGVSGFRWSSGEEKGEERDQGGPEEAGTTDRDPTDEVICIASLGVQEGGG